MLVEDHILIELKSNKAQNSFRGTQKFKNVQCVLGQKLCFAGGNLIRVACEYDFFEQACFRIDISDQYPNPELI